MLCGRYIDSTRAHVRFASDHLRARALVDVDLDWIWVLVQLSISRCKEVLDMCEVQNKHLSIYIYGCIELVYIFNIYIYTYYIYIYIYYIYTYYMYI